MTNNNTFVTQRHLNNPGPLNLAAKKGYFSSVHCDAQLSGVMYAASFTLGVSAEMRNFILGKPIP